MPESLPIKDLPVISIFLEIIFILFSRPSATTALWLQRLITFALGLWSWFSHHVLQRSARVFWVRHEAIVRSCFMQREPPVLLGEPRGLNKEQP